ncbi:MAG: tetratricopeptide repeat protein [Luteibaculaceae bacterium]
MPKTLLTILFCFGLLFVSPLLAQQSEALNDPEIEFKTGLHLYEKEKYGAAIKHFQNVLRESNNTHSENHVNASYYIAMSSYALYNSDAEFLLRAFLSDYPESMHANEIRFTLANFYYRKKKYKDAVVWFNTVATFPLTKEEKQAFYFKRGVSLMNLEQKDEAINDFLVVKGQEGIYQQVATYYFAHLNYEKRNLQTAVNAFKKLVNSEEFATIAPYYIAQIYYLQGNYDSLLVYAAPLLDIEGVQQKGEIARLVGEAHYRKNDFASALPYLELYKTEIGNTTREDKFQLGFVYYKVGKLDKAEKEFTGVDTQRDSLSQAAAYYLGDIYVQQERYNFAKNAFKKAASLNFDPIITEDALFNYGRFAYITSNDPFNEAAKAFLDYIERYPNTERANEAYTYLINIYMRTGRFKEGLEQLEKIQKKDIRLMEAYQTLAFNRAIQLHKIREYKEALVYFDKAKTYKINPTTEAERIFWLADTHFRLKNNLKAAETFAEFLKTTGAFASPLYNLAYYNAGYALYKEKMYKEASVQFRQFIARTSERDSVRLNDASLRIGDYFYLEKEYDRAIEYYNKAIQFNPKSTDYALFHIALSQGFSNRQVEEQATLQKIINKGQASKYYLESRFRMGNSLLRINEDNKALFQFNKILEEYPNSAYVKRSLLQIGLIQSRAGNTNEALAAFKKVVNDFPNDQDTRDALNAIKSLYVSTGNMADFNTFVAGRGDFSTSELDSANYMAAEQRMFRNAPCQEIVDAFTKYLSDFPNAIFLVNAKYYRAECLARLKEYEKAMEDYLVITEKPVNNFTEPSFFAAATLAFEMENYNRALRLYEGLEKIAEFRTNVVEAQIGIMRAAFKVKNYDKAIAYAAIVLKAAEAPADIKQEAEFTIAKALFEQNKLDDARVAYARLAQKYPNRTGAESLFKQAEITFLLAEYEDIEPLIFDLIQRFPTFDLYKAKGLVLLARAYLELGEDFQAQATLESITDNETALRGLLLPADADKIIAEAKALLKEIANEKEKANTKPETELRDIDIKSEEIDEREMRRIFNEDSNNNKNDSEQNPENNDHETKEE